jgi:hypothetical protein
MFAFSYSFHALKAEKNQVNYKRLSNKSDADIVILINFDLWALESNLIFAQFYHWSKICKTKVLS